MWKEGDRVHFVCKVCVCVCVLHKRVCLYLSFSFSPPLQVVETREVCLSGGYIDLHPASSSSAVIAGPTVRA